MSKLDSEQAITPQFSERLISLTPGGMYRCFLGEKIRIEFVSDGLLRLVGYTRAEFNELMGEKRDVSALILPEDYPLYQAFFSALSRQETLLTQEYRVRHRDGRILYISDTMESVRDADGNMNGYSSVTDISSLKEEQSRLTAETRRYETLNHELEISNRRFRMIAEYTGIVFYEYDVVEHAFLSFDNTFNMLGFTDTELMQLVEEVRKQTTHPTESLYYFLAHSNDAATLQASEQELFSHGQSRCEVRLRRKDGKDLWCMLHRFLLSDKDGRPQHILGCLIDNEHGHRQTAALKKQLSAEPLTGLYNKTTAFALIDDILCKKADSRHAMMVTDLDNFKQINDQLGHAVGDKLLTAFANRLRTLFRADDILVRYGGDEFLLFLPNITSEAIVRHKALQILHATQTEIGIQTTGMEISVSIGVAFSKPGMRVQTLFQNADKALYHAKRKGKSRISIYDSRFSVASSDPEQEPPDSPANSGSAILKVMPDHLEILYCSEHLAELLGCTTDEQRAFLRTCNGWDFVYSSDIPIARKTLETALNSQHSCDALYRLRRFDGGIIWVQSLTKTLGQEDEFPTIHVVFNNISKHIALYNDILDASEQIVHFSDIHTYEVLYANAAAAAYAGKESGTYLGKTCYEWFANRKAPCEGCPLDQIRKEGHCKVERCNAQNNHFYSLQGKALDWQGRPVFVEYVSDITDLREAQVVLNEKQESFKKRQELLEKTYQETLRSFFSLQDRSMCMLQFDCNDDRLLESSERSSKLHLFYPGMTHIDLQNLMAHILDRPDDISTFSARMNPSTLIENYEIGKREDHFDLCFRVPGLGQVYTRFFLVLRQQPASGHIILFLRQVDVSREQYTEAILQHLLPQNYETIGLIDASNGCFHPFSEPESNRPFWRPDYDSAASSYFGEAAGPFLLQNVTEALKTLPRVEIQVNRNTPDGIRKQKVLYTYLNDSRTIILYGKKNTGSDRL